MIQKCFFCHKKKECTPLAGVPCCQGCYDEIADEQEERDYGNLRDDC